MNDDSGEVVGRDFPRPAAYGDIAKSLKREVRLINFGSLAIGCVANRLFRRAQIVGVEISFFVSHAKLGQETEFGSVTILLVVPGHAASEPAVSESGREAVCSLVQEIRHVVGLILIAEIIGGPAGGEELIADSFAVQLHFV